ncbi:hypothetical protein ABK040_004864 [Willaertia magna]
MEQELPMEMENTLIQFQNKLQHLQQLIKPLMDLPLTAKTSKLDAESRAKVNLCCAYTVNTLFYMYLKTQGINPEDHPIKEEIARIQMYFNKLKGVKKSENQKTTTEQQPPTIIITNPSNNNNNTIEEDNSNVMQETPIKKVKEVIQSPKNNSNKKRKTKPVDMKKKKKKQ